MLSTLLAELAQGIPELPGARCKGREELFDQTITRPGGGNHDDTVTYARRAATRLCASCPALTQCAAWVDGLPRSQRPTGVVGGKLTDPQGRRARRARRRVDTPESAVA